MASPPSPPTAVAIADDVVVIDPHQIIKELVTREITRSVADRLAGRYSQPKICEHIGIFDRQREDNPHDARFTPGRLRRMIEEDSPPPGYSAHDRRRISSAPRIDTIDRDAP